MASGRFFLLIFLLVGLSHCGGVPRIIVLNDPLSADEHIRLGLSYESKGEWDLALSEYHAALDKKGVASVIQGYLGNVYYSKKDFSSAKNAYLKSIEENPTNAPVLNNLAAVYLAENQNLKEAERLVLRAIDLDPSRKPYYLDTLGSIYMKRGEHDLALSSYSEAEVLAQPDPALLTELRNGKEQALISLENGNRLN